MVKTTVTTLAKCKTQKTKIAALTAYDAAMTKLLNNAGIDLILVGDSLGMVIQGHETTIPVTMDDMLYHTRCAAKANTSALLVADMPFGSYLSTEQALYNATKLMQAGAAMVKLEGGSDLADIIAKLTKAGIPVCAHLGLMPQSVNQLGGYYVQGKNKEQAQKILDDAKSVTKAGAKLVVLECIPESLATTITTTIKAATIGIGSGKGTDGQILVTHDMLGLSSNTYKFCKSYASLEPLNAITNYIHDVKEGVFPEKEYVLAL
ncbi:MAG: 3-methyl-2-oxobutanoate hydroxymethyltransferase [Legionellales bacterium]|jgi:3-methyl-2-oxobutanoate hydroxymethyltransferase|nr:3-methyl-2-oxobutanoate hydroxymethyltransferase [Legionellales bacterium]